jgi:hypothetical protein
MNNKHFSFPLGLAVWCLTMGIITPAFAQTGNQSDVTGVSVTTSTQTPGATTLPTGGLTTPGSQAPIVVAPPTGVTPAISAVINAPAVNTADLNSAIAAVVNAPASPTAGQLPPGQVAQLINSGIPAGNVIGSLLNITPGGQGAQGADQIAAFNQTPVGASIVTNAVALGLSLQGLVQGGQVSAATLLQATQQFNSLITAAASAPGGIQGSSVNLQEIQSIRNTLSPLIKAAQEQEQGKNN